MPIRTFKEITLPMLGTLPAGRASWLELGEARTIALPSPIYIGGDIDNERREWFSGRDAHLPAYGCVLLNEAFAYGDGLAFVDDYLLLDPSITAGAGDIGAWGFFKKVGTSTDGIRNIDDWSEEIVRLDKAVLLTRRSDFVYGHWLLETLPRLKLAQQVGLHDATFIVSAGIEEYQIQVLEVLGISRSAIFKLAPDRSIYCNQLYIPSLAHWSQNMLQPFSSETYDSLSSICKTGADLLPEKIFVTRKTRSHDPRPLLNFDIVEKMVTSNGFTTVDPGSISWSQQIAIFSQAKSIIGLSGSGLHNTVYTGADAHVLTLQPSQSRNLLQTAIASVRHHKVSYLFGESFSGDDKNTPDCPYAIDVNLLHHAVEICFGG